MAVVTDRHSDNRADNDMVRVVQLSDTHFLESGHEPEGGFGYDTYAAFDAVLADVERSADQPDLVVVTGDVADHGRVEQYRLAADAFARFKMPVNVCPGNHDQDAAFTASIGRPGVATSRVVTAGAWGFLFVDSNAGVMVPSATGRHVDPDDVADRLHRNGSLGPRESDWIRATCATIDAEHIFIWVHHPPSPPRGLGGDDTYGAEWAALLADLPQVRGLGGGHTHIPTDYVLDGRPVFVAPALKNNFDLDAGTLLPPGYRSYQFAPDGTITSQVRLVDDARWPRSILARSVVALLNGELSHEEFDAIVVRRRERMNS